MELVLECRYWRKDNCMSDDPMATVLAALSRLEAGQAKLATRDDLTKLADDVAKLAGDVAKLTGDVIKLAGDVTKLTGDMIKLRTDLMARMDRLQDAITAIRDDIAVNLGTADQVRRANDNTRDELRALSEVVTTMLRQIQRLQTDVRELKGDP